MGQNLKVGLTGGVDMKIGDLRSPVAKTIGAENVMYASLVKKL